MQKIKMPIFSTLTIILILILSFNIYNFLNIQLFHQKLTTVNGYALLKVVSYSMEPTIKKGDLIVIDTLDNNYFVDDIITFSDNDNTLVTHRIVNIDNDIYITKGDSNDTVDEGIKKDKIIGKYKFKISFLGQLITSLKNPLVSGLIFVIGICLCYLISMKTEKIDINEQEYNEFLKEKNKKDNQKNKRKK